MLTTEEMQRIMVELMTGKPPAPTTEEGEQFRAEVQRDIEEAKRKGYQIDLPKEWEVGDDDGNPVANTPNPVANTPSPTMNTRWKFNSNEEKLRLFLLWLQAQSQSVVLGDPTDEDAYWRVFVQQGYQKGAARAFDDVHTLQRAQLSGTEELAWYGGTREQFLREAFNHPVSIEKVKLLAARTYEDLKGVTQQMSVVMGRVLADGMAQGLSPRQTARNLAQTVEEIGKQRALTIARTESTRAHAEGQLDALETSGVTEVGVASEWHTVPDHRRCELCAPMEGVVLTIKEARGLIPRHPNCRCAFLPANVGEDTSGQRRTKSRIEDAVRRSLSAERPKHTKRTIAQQRRKSRWGGADLKVSKRRPKGIVNTLLFNYSPTQPRDKYGKWTTMGGLAGGLGGAAPIADASMDPSIKAMAKPGELKEFGKLKKERGALNKKIKAGTATPEEIQRAKQVKQKIADYRSTWKQRFAESGGVSTPKPTTPTTPTKPTLPVTPTSKHEYHVAQDAWESQVLGSYTARKLVKSYTGTGYHEYRKCVQVPDKCSPETKERMQKLVSVLQKAPGWKGTVHRGIRLRPKDWESLQQELDATGTMTVKGISSASRHRGTAQGFAGSPKSHPSRTIVVLSARIKSGVKLENLSYHSHEGEVVMLPGTRLRMIKKEKTPTGVWNIELEEM